jgi:large subunit ribosomal protein L9
MKVILFQDVEKLGSEGDVVNVKPGFGQNYLIPRGLAAIATKGKLKQWTEERRQASRKLAQKKSDAERLATELAGMELVLRAKVGEERRIFGSITSQQIVEALASQGVTVERRHVTLEEDIRMLGVYSASVRVHPEVVGQVKVRVEPEGMPMGQGGTAAAAPAEGAPAPEAAAPAEDEYVFDGFSDVEEEDED